MCRYPDALDCRRRDIGDEEYSGEAAAGLALLGDKRFEAAVMKRLDSIDPYLEGYQTICAALAHANPTLLLDTLVAKLDRSSARLQGRFSTAIGLGWLRDERAVAPLVRLLNEDDPYFLRAAAAQSLGRTTERSGPRWNSGYLDLFNPYAAPPTLLGNGVHLGICDRL